MWIKFNNQNDAASGRSNFFSNVFTYAYPYIDKGYQVATNITDNTIRWHFPRFAGNAGEVMVVDTPVGEWLHIVYRTMIGGFRVETWVNGEMKTARDVSGKSNRGEYWARLVKHNYFSTVNDLQPRVNINFSGVEFSNWAWWNKSISDEEIISLYEN